MKDEGKARIGVVPIESIKRIPCLMFGASSKLVEKHKSFANERGYRLPIVVSDSAGCMTLLVGSAAFEASIEDNVSEVPAIIVKTDGDADGLIFALKSAELDASPGAVAIGDAIVQLTDVYRMPRKAISETLGKSPAWVARLESLSRRLAGPVKKMVVDGHVKPRTAQEIARLPEDVQVAFSVSATNEFLSKENVSYLVKRYLNEDTGDDERARIVDTPRLALPCGAKRRGKCGGDMSVSARLSHAVAMCLDSAAYLTRILARSDIGDAAVRMQDILALDGSLERLRLRLRDVFYPGQNTVDGGIMLPNKQEGDDASV